MNYRHHYHAGNFADVVKHVVLMQLFRALQLKPKGFLYLDTHAGRGAYDLQQAGIGASLAREPEWPDGIGRLWNRGDCPEPVAEYLALVRGFDHARGNLESTLRFYPGSPWIAARLSRAQDRLAFCEMHSAEAGGLRQEFRVVPGVAVHESDGYVALRGLLPPPERRALVLIDPPYEAQDEFAQATTALGEALRRFPSGVYALWYPLTQRARVDEFVAAIMHLAPPPTLLAELAVAGDNSDRKLKGCGLVIVNPPWQFEPNVRLALDFLAPILAQESGGSARTTWLVPEA